MSDDLSPPKTDILPARRPAPRDPKADRLVDALRANLRRRKAADRARLARPDAGSSSDGDG